jgi:hypothetical protein
MDTDQPSRAGIDRLPGAAWSRLETSLAGWIECMRRLWIFMLD